VIGPLLKAQAVAFLTKKLLDSPAFVAGVQSIHRNVNEIKDGAYETLLQAT
ncbi:hypothetical protein T439DRAFT_270083, partial [Meredithblackwellia eburnea MCA 4105]